MSRKPDIPSTDAPSGEAFRAMLHAVVDQVLAAREREQAGTGGDLRQVARAVYESRRARNRLLPPGLLGEPAWDMLLDLYANHDVASRSEEGGLATGVSTKSVCLAADVPYSTAWRCLGALEADGLIERFGDAIDTRRNLVRLTGRGEAAVRHCVEAVAGLTLG